MHLLVVLCSHQILGIALYDIIYQAVFLTKSQVHACRILKMMHTIAAHTAENRMTPSAVAACMAPLLLRPLLAGECEMEDDFDMSGDCAAQLIAAANAANSAQGIVTTLLEEYESIFNVSFLCYPSVLNIRMIILLLWTT